MPTNVNLELKAKLRTGRQIYADKQRNIKLYGGKKSNKNGRRSRIYLHKMQSENSKKVKDSKEEA